MTSSKTIPVAYVTKWATTDGIRVVRGGEVHVSDEGTRYLTNRNGLFVGPKDWTEDKAEAEKRYRTALDKAYKSAQKKANALLSLMCVQPKYTEAP